MKNVSFDMGFLNESYGWNLDGKDSNEKLGVGLLQSRLHDYELNNCKQPSIIHPNFHFTL